MKMKTKESGIGLKRVVFGVKWRSQERTSQDIPLSKVMCVVLSFCSAYLLKISSEKLFTLKMQMV